MSNATSVKFLAFANDRQHAVRYLRKLPKEAWYLRTALETAPGRTCEVIIRQNATRDDILDVFQNADYRNRIAVFHSAAGDS